MKMPHFDKDQKDKQTYAPFCLEDARETEWHDLRLSFDDWDWLKQFYETDEIDDYYLNGYGIEGLIKAVRYINALEVYKPEIDYNSEGDTCYIHFTDLNEAIVTAELAATMIKDRAKLTETIAVAREQGFED